MEVNDQTQILRIVWPDSFIDKPLYFIVHFGKCVFWKKTLILNL